MGIIYIREKPENDDEGEPEVLYYEDNDLNADWIKSLPGHAAEQRIHDELAKKLAAAKGAKQEKPEE